MGTDNFVLVIMLGRPFFLQHLKCILIPGYCLDLLRHSPHLKQTLHRNVGYHLPECKWLWFEDAAFTLGNREPFCCLAISLLKFSRDGIAICNDRVGRKPPRFQRPRSLTDWDKVRAHFMWVQGCVLSNRDNFVIKVAHKCQSAYFRFSCSCLL